MSKKPKTSIIFDMKPNEIISLSDMEFVKLIGEQEMPFLVIEMEYLVNNVGIDELVVALIKWRRILFLLQIGEISSALISDAGIDNCALCHIHYDANAKVCRSCPVTFKSDEEMCLNTPYPLWTRTVDKASNDIQALLEQAQKEYDYLYKIYDYVEQGCPGMFEGIEDFADEDSEPYDRIPF